MIKNFLFDIKLWAIMMSIYVCNQSTFSTEETSCPTLDKKWINVEITMPKEDTIHYVTKVKMSDKGKDFIKSKETLVLKAYQIPGEKHKTIGYGHYMMSGEQYTSISKAKAEKLFDEDISKVEKSIERILDDFDPRFKYTQGFIDGLGSLIFNCGETGVKSTEFYARMCRSRYDTKKRNINHNDLCFSIAAIKNDKIFFKGHVSRRYDEHKMMLD